MPGAVPQTRLIELQQMQRERMIEDADKLVSLALDIARLVVDLRAGVEDEGMGAELAAHMAGAVNASVALHVRYASLLSYRISECERRQM